MNEEAHQKTHVKKTIQYCNDTVSMNSSNKKFAMQWSSSRKNHNEWTYWFAVQRANENKNGTVFWEPITNDIWDEKRLSIKGNRKALRNSRNHHHNIQTKMPFHLCSQSLINSLNERNYTMLSVSWFHCYLIAPSFFPFTLFFSLARGSHFLVHFSICWKRKFKSFSAMTFILL